MSEKKRILIVEDEALIALSEVNILKHYGYEASFVTNGEKAIKEVSSTIEKPDLILMDINLGSGIDGTEAAKIILKDFDIPIVFLSSHTDRDTVEKTRNITRYGYILKDSGDAVLINSIETAFELYYAGRELKKNRETLKTYIDFSPVGFFIVDGEGNYRFVNRVGMTAIGYSSEEILSMKIPDIIAPESLKEGIAHFRDVKTTGRASADLYFRRKDGTKCCATVNAVKISENEYIAFCIDITEKKQLENELRKGAEKYREFVEASIEGIWAIDENFEITYVNSRVADILGYKKEEILGKRIDSFMFPEDMDDHLKMMENRKSGIKQVYERRLRHKNGSDVWCIVSAVPIRDDEGVFRGAFSMITDITVRKSSEEQIRRMLDEKELLIQEVHHRVKNNMQIISSLLSFQADYIDDSKAKDALKESQNRIRLMQTVYDMLNNSDDIRRINMNAYISNLLIFLNQTYNMIGKNIYIETVIENISLNSKQVVPVGIITNELVTNALKYAFPESKSGIISIFLKKEEKSKIIIKISDNGIGLPDNISLKDSGGFGLKLVDMMVKQIKGTIETERENGTRFIITFNMA